MRGWRAFARLPSAMRFGGKKDPRKRVDELERAVEHLEKQLDSCAGGSAIQQ